MTRPPLLNSLSAAGRAADHIEIFLRRRRFFLPLIGALMVLALQAKFLIGSYESFDFRLWDGSWYWGWGQDVAMRFQFPSFENAPVYAAYYAVFHLLFSDPFNVYYTHRVAMLFIIGIALYLLLRRISSPLPAWLLSAYFPWLIGDGGPAEYAVRSFVILPVLLGYMAATRQGLSAGFVLFLSFAVASLVRPEVGVTLPILLVLCVASEWRNRVCLTTRLRQARLRQAGYAVVMAACLATTVAITMSLSQTSGRSWLAFGQHYSIGYQERHPEIRMNPWLDWKDYLKKSFGQATSVKEALFNNPSAFLAHVGWNVSLLPDAVDYAMKPAYPLKSPVAGFVFGGLNFFCIYCSGLLLSSVLLLRKRRNPQSAVSLGRLWGAVLISLVPVLISSLVIRPSPDHMAILKAAALLPLCPALQVVVERWTPRKSRQLALMVVTFVVFFVCYPTPFHPPKPRAIFPVVAAIPEVPGREPYTLIADSAISYCTYTDRPRCKPLELLWTQGKTRTENIEDYLLAHNTRVIVIGARLMPQLGPEWRDYLVQLVRSPDRHGWRLVGRTTEFLVLARV